MQASLYFTVEALGVSDCFESFLHDTGEGKSEYFLGLRVKDNKTYSFVIKMAEL
jgi:hypothetical protein